jgi:glycosyltransferase involved in cell wall biosynthesis
LIIGLSCPRQARKILSKQRNAMKRALIATLFNEANTVAAWWDSLVRQSVLPDEISIVDGGSTDGTWEKLQELARHSPVPVKLQQQRCNIAEGRNRAIEATDAEIIAATDAGSFPESDWFGEITRPLLENAELDVIGGRSVPLVENDFQRGLLDWDGPEPEPSAPDKVYPSSRNIAFRRSAWAAVGGYPEWLTLTAEDALFNFQLHAIEKKFTYRRSAIVHWPARENAPAYFKMLYHYGFGAAEARLYAPYYYRRLVITLFPPLLLLSHHRFQHLKFRYQKNAASALGWLKGHFNGHRPPADWRRVKGILLSPQAQQSADGGRRS